MRDVIFSYTASLSVSGSGICYATEVLGIPSLAIETSAYYGDYSDWQNNLYECQPEVIAAGAEALGNILLEFYKQYNYKEIPSDTHINDLIEAKLAQIVNAEEVTF